MKKALIIFFFLFVLAGAALAAFIATFDLDRYRPQIVKQIESAAGRKVAIQRLKLGWKNGIALEARGISLPGPAGGKPDASIDLALVRLDLAPLLKREIRVKGIWLVGLKLVVEKSADGNFTVAGIPLTGPGGDTLESEKTANVSPLPPTSPRGAAPGQAGGFAAHIDELSIENAEIRYLDRSGASPLDVRIADADVSVKNVSLKDAIRFAARAALFGDKQNVAVGGKLLLPQGAKPGRLDDFTLEADLDAVDWEELGRSIPAVRSAGLREPTGGLLEARVDDMELSPASASNAAAHVTLKNGRLALSSVPLPLESVLLEASLKAGNAEVKNLSARLADGTIQLQGRIQDLGGSASSEFRASARDLAIGKLARAASSRSPRLEGRLSLDFEGRGQGLGSTVIQTLTGQGRLALKEGVLLNSNLLRTVVQKIEQIPGVGREAISRIPPQYLAKINEPHTVLKPLELPFAVQRGRIFFERLQVPTDLFVLAGTGSIGFDKSVSMPAAIFFERGFSQALMAAAPPTQYFVNTATNQIEIQMMIRGVLPHPQVIPNLDAALQRVGQQVVTDLLQKKKPKEILSGLLSGPAAAQPQQQAQQGGIPLEPASGQESQEQSAPSQEDQLLALLSNALNKNKSQ